IAETMRQEIWGANISYRDAPDGRVTLSMGVAAMVPPLGSDWADLLSLADNLLYLAKRDGRNMIKIPDDLQNISGKGDADV
ncbi:MAG: diguanylate cyclase, partial [Rhodospirillaceae bacterium]|nr:diguanylate cyclase [Rhodospirillaceae bacterium]